MTRNTAILVILFLLGVDAIVALWRFGGLGHDEVPVHDTVPAIQQNMMPSKEVTDAEPPKNLPDEFRVINRQSFFKTASPADSTGITQYCARYANIQWPISVNGERKLDQLHYAIIKTMFGESTDNIYIALDNNVLQPRFCTDFNDTEVEEIKSLPSSVPAHHVYRSRHILQVYLTSERIVEFEMRIYEDNGAGNASGVSDSHHYLAYDRMQGRMLTLDDIVSDKNAMLQAINRKIDQLNRRGMCLKQASRIPEFRIEPDAIHFVFPRYEIGFAADNEVTIKLPYKNVMDILSPHMKDIVNNNSTYKRPQRH